MHPEKSQPEGKRIEPETRFTEFSELSIGPGLGFLGLRQRPIFDFFPFLTLKCFNHHSSFISFMTFYVA